MYSSVFFVKFTRALFDNWELFPRKQLIQICTKYMQLPSLAGYWHAQFLKTLIELSSRF